MLLNKLKKKSRWGVPKSCLCCCSLPNAVHHWPVTLRFIAVLSQWMRQR